MKSERGGTKEEEMEEGYFGKKVMCAWCLGDVEVVGGSSKLGRLARCKMTSRRLQTTCYRMRGDAMALSSALRAGEQQGRRATAGG